MTGTFAMGSKAWTGENSR